MKFFRFLDQERVPQQVSCAGMRRVGVEQAGIFINTNQRIPMDERLAVSAQIEGGKPFPFDGAKKGIVGRDLLCHDRSRLRGVYPFLGREKLVVVPFYGIEMSLLRKIAF